VSQVTMTTEQVGAMLWGLPASCAIAAVDGIEPPVSPDIARFVLLNFESEGIVSWRREAPQKIELTPKGEKFLEELQRG
jgi:hypothetical protein